MKRFLSTLTLAALLASPFTAMAATFDSGDLIKASGPAVYYYSSNGKRYVFPTERTYFTWYSDFSGVKTVSDSELASLMIGGNVTYKPGTRLVKITTDPKVYAVDANGTLRWVQTESVARELYGDQWATLVDDIPDAFFVNYKVGAVISNSLDFPRSSITSAATSIDTDKQAAPATSTETPNESTTTTTSTVSYTGTLTSSDQEAPANEQVTYTATASPSTGISLINIFFGTNLIKTCSASPCSTQYALPSQNSTSTVSAEFHWDGQSYTSSLIQTVTNTGLPGVQLLVTTPQIKPGSNREVIVRTNTQFVPSSIEILIDGSTRKICDSQTECRLVEQEPGVIGDTHEVYAILRDGAGLPRQTESQSIKVVSNPGPQVTVESGKGHLFTGEQVDVTVTGSDEDGVAWTEIWLNGEKIKHCDLSVCTTNLGPWSSAQHLYVTGLAEDLTGMQGRGTSTEITVDSQ